MRKTKSHITLPSDAVKYGRVSSKEQEKEGFSIPAQFKLTDQDCSAFSSIPFFVSSERYARSHGLKVVREFVDVIVDVVLRHEDFNSVHEFLG